MKIPSKKNEQQSQDSADQKMKRLGRKGYFAPSKRGYKVPGGGYSNYIDLPSEYRGSSRQVCGLWPFSSGAGSPLDGVPWGKNLLTNSAVGFDHFTAYERGIISQPSLYMESFPALGKSTLVGKICMGLDYYGVKNMVLGDVKGEHVARTVAMGGKRIPLGNGRGYLNPMDYGVAEDAIKRLSGSLREEVLVEAHDHSKALLIALMTIARREAPSEEEEIVIDVGMRLLRERFDGVPLIGDLSQLIAEKPEALRNAVLDRGDDARYADSTDALRKTLNGLMSGGPLGTMFSRHTAEADRFDLTRSCVFDLSAISDTLPAQQAAGMLASWSTGFASVKV
ncbi:ATP/GTP-binding protein, partial [Pseudarthrobacter sp. PS3-L1]|nr:ATP/GTP-binding protein [Pseudarthrobacter sp. PS3-L1]